MSDDDTYYDSDGDPHTAQDHDINDVPYMAPVCGWDGEAWPCKAVRERT